MIRKPPGIKIIFFILSILLIFIYLTSSIRVYRLVGISSNRITVSSQGEIFSIDSGNTIQGLKLDRVLFSHALINGQKIELGETFIRFDETPTLKGKMIRLSLR